MDHTKEHDHDEKLDTQRLIQGMQSDKRALFMAALAARNHNPTLKAVYDRLVQNGKKPLVALMRKLITIINARVRDAHHQPITQLS
jgi:transposase